MMINTIQSKKHMILRKAVNALMALAFFLNTAVPPSLAQMLPQLPLPGQMVWLTPAFQPPVLKGMVVHPENPLLFDFIVDRGQDRLDNAALKDESTALIKYFLASMTIPDDDAWVNLSPYEQDRVIPEPLSRTEMGRVMLEQDYILKQLSASLTNPDEELGRKYWDEVRARARQQFGTDNIPLNTFNKVWIVPDSATVVEKDGFAYITESRLKVMSDVEYKAQEFDVRNPSSNGQQATSNDDEINRLSTDVFRELILPQLEKEINEGKNFAPTRQVYQSVILAAWYKRALRESLLGKIYMDRSKVEGVETDIKDIKEKVYAQYLEAFRKGVYNFIKEDVAMEAQQVDTATSRLPFEAEHERNSAKEGAPAREDRLNQTLVPRKYFSGGNIMAASPILNIKKGDAAVRQALKDAGDPTHAIVTAGLREDPNEPRPRVNGQPSRQPVIKAASDENASRVSKGLSGDVPRPDLSYSDAVSAYIAAQYSENLIGRKISKGTLNEWVAGLRIMYPALFSNGYSFNDLKSYLVKKGASFTRDYGRGPLDYVPNTDGLVQISREVYDTIQSDLQKVLDWTKTQEPYVALHLFKAAASSPVSDVVTSQKLLDLGLHNHLRDPFRLQISVTKDDENLTIVQIINVDRRLAGQSAGISTLLKWLWEKRKLDPRDIQRVGVSEALSDPQMGVAYFEGSGTLVVPGPNNFQLDDLLESAMSATGSPNIALTRIAPVKEKNTAASPIVIPDDDFSYVPRDLSRWGSTWPLYREKIDQKYWRSGIPIADRLWKGGLTPEVFKAFVLKFESITAGNESEEDWDLIQDSLEGFEGLKDNPQLKREMGKELIKIFPYFRLTRQDKKGFSGDTYKYLIVILNRLAALKYSGDEQNMDFLAGVIARKAAAERSPQFLVSFLRLIPDIENEFNANTGNIPEADWSGRLMEEYFLDAVRGVVANRWPAKGVNNFVDTLRGAFKNYYDFKPWNMGANVGPLIRDPAFFARLESRTKEALGDMGRQRLPDYNQSQNGALREALSGLGKTVVGLMKTKKLGIANNNKKWLAEIVTAVQKRSRLKEVSRGPLTYTVKRDEILDAIYKEYTAGSDPDYQVLNAALATAFARWESSGQGALSETDFKNMTGIPKADIFGYFMAAVDQAAISMGMKNRAVNLDHDGGASSPVTPNPDNRESPSKAKPGNSQPDTVGIIAARIEGFSKRKNLNNDFVAKIHKLRSDAQALEWIKAQRADLDSASEGNDGARKANEILNKAVLPGKEPPVNLLDSAKALLASLEDYFRIKDYSRDRTILYVANNHPQDAFFYNSIKPSTGYKPYSFQSADELLDAVRGNLQAFRRAPAVVTTNAGNRGVNLARTLSEAGLDIPVFVIDPKSDKGTDWLRALTPQDLEPYKYLHFLPEAKVLAKQGEGALGDLLYKESAISGRWRWVITLNTKEVPFKTTLKYPFHKSDDPENRGKLTATVATGTLQKLAKEIEKGMPRKALIKLIRSTGLDENEKKKIIAQLNIKTGGSNSWTALRPETNKLDAIIDDDPNLAQLILASHQAVEKVERRDRNAGGIPQSQNVKPVPIFYKVVPFQNADWAKILAVLDGAVLEGFVESVPVDGGVSGFWLDKNKEKVKMSLARYNQLKSEGKERNEEVKLLLKEIAGSLKKLPETLRLYNALVPEDFLDKSDWAETRPFAPEMAANIAPAFELWRLQKIIRDSRSITDEQRARILNELDKPRDRKAFLMWAQDRAGINPYAELRKVLTAEITDLSPARNLELAREIFSINPVFTTFRGRSTASSPVSRDLGGIDFDASKINLQIKRDGSGVPLPLPQQDLEFIDIKGLYPFIINIMPVNVQTLPLLGMLEDEPEVVLSMWVIESNNHSFIP